MEKPQSLQDIQNFCINEDAVDTLLFDSYDYCTAFLGLTWDKRAVYSYEGMIEHLVEQTYAESEHPDELDPEEVEISAIDWVDYNTIGSITDQVVIAYLDDEEALTQDPDKLIAIPYTFTSEMSLPVNEDTKTA